MRQVEGSGVVVAGGGEKHAADDHGSTITISWMVVMKAKCIVRNCIRFL